MLDKSLFKEYIDARKLVEETEADLRTLRLRHENMAVDIVKASNPEFPYQPMHVHVEGVDYAHYKDPDDIRRLETLLKERRKIAKQKQIDVEAWMNQVPSRIQRIFRFKFVMGLTWADTGRRMGALNGEAVRKEFDRFMKDDGTEETE